MSEHFDSLGAFAAHIAGSVSPKTLIAVHLALEACAAEVEKTAKSEIGVYQPAVGDFPEWPDLAEATVEDRIAQGYSPDEPLLREGDLRDSIEHEVGILEAVIGSKSLIAMWQELGTEHIPPRPFLGPALVRNEETVRALLGFAFVWGISSGQEIGGLYRFLPSGAPKLDLGY